MAVINADKINRLSIENSIKIESIKNVRRNFAEGILSQLSVIKKRLVDIVDTYEYMVCNRVGLSIFKVEGYDFRINLTNGRYIHHGWYKDRIDSYVKYYIDDDRFSVGASFWGMYESYSYPKDDYNTERIYKEKFYKEHLERFVKELNVYTDIVLDRLANL